MPERPRSSLGAARRPLCPSQAALEEWIQSVLPGQSASARTLRAQVLAFCANPTERTVLLRGPIGSGKSTLARLMAFGKRVAPLRDEKARDFIRNVRYDIPGRISLRSMSWYVELAVTGLTDSLADAQLFGVAPGAATDVKERLGVFEQAKDGRSGAGDAGSTVTGGVVFLDEIADIPANVQTKLLPVLSGGSVYRLGGEGDRRYEVDFNGVVIAATWHTLSPNQFRRDLLSRLSSTTILVPGLSERQEDLPDIIGSLETTLVTRQRTLLNRIADAEPGFVDRVFWRRAAADLRALSSRDRASLIEVDWSSHGNLRGLTQVMERALFSGESIDHILATRSRLHEAATAQTNAIVQAELFYRELLQQPGNNRGLAGLVRSTEVRRRDALRETLRSRADYRDRLASHLGLTDSALRRQIGELTRTRTRSDR